MLITIDTKKSLEDAGRDLEAAVVKHRFGVMGMHNLREAMRSKGVDYDGACLVYEVCNPHKAKAVLEAHPEMSTALPCRISVYREAGKVRLSTIRPTALVRTMGAPDLEAVAADVEGTLKAIMEDAASTK